MYGAEQRRAKTWLRVKHQICSARAARSVVVPHADGTQTSMERLQEEIADIRRARNALPNDLQFAVLCNRSMERLREYVDVMARARTIQGNSALRPPAASSFDARWSAACPRR
jgi:hypothetical protein